MIKFVKCIICKVTYNTVSQKWIIEELPLLTKEFCAHNFFFFLIFLSRTYLPQTAIFWPWGIVRWRLDTTARWSRKYPMYAPSNYKQRKLFGSGNIQCTLLQIINITALWFRKYPMYAPSNCKQRQLFGSGNILRFFREWSRLYLS